jgi:hypothetical protein
MAPPSLPSRRVISSLSLPASSLFALGSLGSLGSLGALVALGACGGSGSSTSESAPQDADSGGTQAVGAIVDGAADSTSAAPTDGAAGDALSSDDAGNKPGLDPRPPAGFSPCGSGSFTQAEAHTACTTFAETPKLCDAVTIGGGTWQSWCEPTKTKVYFWAQLTGATQPPTGCAPKFRFGGYNLSPGGAGGWGTVREDGTTVSLDGVLQIQYQTSGVGALAASAQLATPIAGSSLCTYNDPNAPIVLAFNVTW